MNSIINCKITYNSKRFFLIFFQWAASLLSVTMDMFFWNICKIYILKKFLVKELIFLNIHKDQDAARIV